MYYVIGNLLNKLCILITAPGIVVHEMAHRFVCDLTHIPVYAVDYLAPFSQTNGSVLYKYTQNLRKTFFINSAPLFINSILAMLLSLPFVVSYSYMGTFNTASLVVQISYVMLAWLGFSIGFHASPSNQDIYNIVSVLKKPRKHVPLYISSTVNILRIIAFLRLIGFDLLYAWALTQLLPALIFY